MASKFRLDVTVQENANGAISQIQPLKKSPAMILGNIGRYFEGLGMGRVGTSTRVVTTAVAATGSVLFASFVEDDTITVGATVLTGKDSPSGENQFEVDGNDAADAAAFAACVNAHSVLSKYVSASANSATVTLTILVPGVIGNGVTLARSAHATVTAFASGAEDTPVTLSHGS